ncbi:hypothetical protein L5515_002870 [Caenorhabditis briggsae]|uniref:Uncharacterized protein n=1 Tax=Caenorhabditis briggsae TaxID=6238 RepID=A0AAE9J6A8_CAEBR|nr:hypothetical protein L5515_002870 [Caenorhabditis briggsae]
MSSLNAVQELRIAESDIKVLQLEIMELEKDRFVVEEKADNEEKNAVYWKRMAEHFESKYKSERKANRDTQKGDGEEGEIPTDSIRNGAHAVD